MVANLRKCLIRLGQKFFKKSYFTKIHKRVTENHEVFFILLKILRVASCFSWCDFVKQLLSFNLGRTQNNPLTNINVNLFTSSLGIIIFLETNFLLSTLSK